MILKKSSKLCLIFTEKRDILFIQEKMFPIKYTNNLVQAKQNLWDLLTKQRFHFYRNKMF